MHFPNPLLFLLLVLLVLLPSSPFAASLRLPTPALEPRDHTSTTAAINNIIHDQSVLQAEVEAFTGTREEALSISAAAGKLNTDLNLATAEIVMSTYSAFESYKLTMLVVPLGPTHIIGLAELSAKAPLFAALGVTTQVRNQLLQLSRDNNSFWTALVEKLAPDDQDVVEAAGNQTRAAYQDALAAF